MRDRLLWFVLAVIGATLILLVANNDAGSTFGISNDRLGRGVYLALWGLVIAAGVLASRRTMGHALRNLERLAQLGCRMAIDDYGTGYSSLAYLKRLPVHELKIDRSFVARMAVDDEISMIVRSTVDLGHNLGLKVVAEGVEDLTAWKLLRALGCDDAQGYFMSAPLPAASLVSWIRRNDGTFDGEAAPRAHAG